MFNFRKVKPMKDGNENKTQIKKDQANYENKVRALRTACDNFGNYLKKEVTEETKFLDIAKEFEGEKNGFGKQMKKSWLLSRTSKLLREMKKNLLKSKNETFDPQKIGDYLECFEFKREEPKKGYIKRSAIDDKKVYDFFNENSKGSIREILIKRQEEAKEESIELNKQLSIVLDQADTSLAASGGTLGKATDVQKGVEQILSDIKKYKGIKEEDINTLNKQDKELQQCIDALQQATKNLGEQKKQTKKDMDNKENTNGEKWTSLNALCRAIGANDAATSELNSTIGKVKEVHTKVKESIEEAQKKAKEESIELDKDAEIVFGQANESLDASEEARDEATDVQNGMEKTRKSVRSDREIEPETKKESMTSLNGQIGELEQDKSGSQQATQELKKQQKETEKIIKDENSTPRERMDSLDALRQATVANDEATSQLNGTVGKAEEVHAEVKENIEEANANPFDSKTGTFTIRTEDDFKKIKGFKDKIEKVVVGEGITTIKDKAFAYCTALTSINLGNVTTIGDKAFWLCDSLASINLGNVTTIGEDAFFRCTSLGRLVSIDFKNVETIKERAFSGCTSLGSIDLGKITTIGESAFSGCKSLKSINLGNVTTIGDKAFLGTALTSINLGNVQTIGDNAFLGTALTSINLGNVTTIGKEAFSSCTSLGSINLGNVTTIGEEAFSSCTSLGSINFESVETIGEWAFSGCRSLASINLGNVQTIGDKAFLICTGLKKVILPQDGKKAKEIRDIICSQTRKTAGDGNNNTIEFVNDPEPAAATQET